MRGRLGRGRRVPAAAGRPRAGLQACLAGCALVGLALAQLLLCGPGPMPPQATQARPGVAAVLPAASPAPSGEAARALLAPAAGTGECHPAPHPIGCCAGPHSAAVSLAPQPLPAPGPPEGGGTRLPEMLQASGGALPGGVWTPWAVVLEELSVSRT